MKYYELFLNKSFESIVINENGVVVSRLRTVSGDCHNLSGNWIVTGLWYKKPFGHIGFLPFKTMVEQYKSLDYHFKNGKCRYGFTDIDHNFERLNSEIKGIEEVEWVDEEYVKGWVKKVSVY